MFPQSIPIFIHTGANTPRDRFSFITATLTSNLPQHPPNPIIADDYRILLLQFLSENVTSGLAKLIHFRCLNRTETKGCKYHRLKDGWQGAAGLNSPLNPALIIDGVNFARDKFISVQCLFPTSDRFRGPKRTFSNIKGVCFVRGGDADRFRAEADIWND